MIEKITRMVRQTRIFLLVAMFAIVTLNVENASSNTGLPGAYDADSEQGEMYLAASDAQPSEQQEEKPAETKNDANTNSMMGCGGGGGGGGGHNWMWIGMLIVLAVVIL